jgi:hypothetical protein
MESKISYYKVDCCDYHLLLDGKLIGIIQKLIKGGWIGKSLVSNNFNREFTERTRKECAKKLIEICKTK